MMKTLSLIVTTFGNSVGLEKIIERYLLATDFVKNNLELIIVNDSVTETVNFYNSQIIVINNTQNIGEANSWQVGANVANGKYLTVLADDDCICFTKIEIIIKKILNSCEYNLFIGSYQLSTADISSKLTKRYFKLDIFQSFFYNRGFVSLYCIYERDLWKQIDGFKDIHGEKIALLNEYYILYLLFCLKSVKPKFIDYVVDINVNENSFSASNSDIAMVQRASKKLLSYVQKKNPPKGILQHFVFALFEFRVYRELYATENRAPGTVNILEAVRLVKPSRFSIGYLFFILYQAIRC